MSKELGRSPGMSNKVADATFARKSVRFGSMMPPSSVRVAVGFAVLGVLVGTEPARAGIGDANLPQFSDGKASTLIMRVPGVASRGRLETVFLCTSFASAPVDIGVEIYTRTGALINDVAAGVGAILDVAPGQTVTLATNGTATYLESGLIPSTDISQGSARIVASSSQVHCNVMLVDDFVSPPVALATLGAGSELSTTVLPSGVALPQFSDGKAATHLSLFPGMIKRLNDETAFFCTSLASTNIDIGVEILGTAGAVANSIAGGNGAALDVLPGQSVTFGTTGTASLFEDVVITVPSVAQGLARIVSTSAEVTCASLILDAGLTPPSAMSTISGSAATGTGTSVTLAAPLPTFLDGKQSVHITTVPGVLKRNTLQTLFLCTSIDDVPIDIGVEIFDLNGTKLNDISTGVGAVASVTPGQTVTIGTSTTAAFLESIVIPLNTGLQGAGRVVASSDRVRCNVIVVDDLTSPPTTLVALAPAVRPALNPAPSTTPLSQFSDGKAATHAAYFPGLIKRGDVETDVFCTSLATAPIDVGVEVFAPNGTVMNSISAGNGALVGVAPGSTVSFGTTGTASLFESTVISLTGVAQGMARVVSTSNDLLCSAMVLDAAGVPPGAMSSLIGFGDACGDGVLDSGEQCDDGSAAWSPGQMCSAQCTFLGCGDADDSSTLTASDALFALRVAVHLASCDPCICDVDHSGGTNPTTAGDALLVLRRAVNLPGALSCQVCG